MSFRAILAAAMAAIGFSAMGAALSLILMAAYMHEAVTAVSNSTESVHTAEEMEVDLLVHARLMEPLARAKLEGQLNGWLLEIRRYVSGPSEQRLYDEVARHLEAYFAAHRRAALAGDVAHEDLARLTSRELENAFGALEALVHENMQQARDTAGRAARWDRNATYFGTAIAVLLLVVIGATLLWLRVFAFRSVLVLESVMRRFAGGDKSARAPVEGPRELRTIASGFNDMVSTLERQHDNQLTFLAGVVHDLRNPLSVLKMAGTLGAGTEALRPELAAKSLQRVKRQAERMERMLEDLMDTARIEAGYLELRLGERDLRDIARDVADLFQDASNNHNIELSLPSDPMLLSCDSLRLEQVLTNLVSNAIKYSPQGGPVKITIRSTPNEAVLEVSDRGIGIPPEEQPHIFEPFRRARVGRDNIPGAGLGLFVAQRITEAHGGRVEVESRPGKGTTFRVHLPFAAAVRAA